MNNEHITNRLGLVLAHIFWCPNVVFTYDFHRIVALGLSLSLSGAIFTLLSETETVVRKVRGFQMSGEIRESNSSYFDVSHPIIITLFNMALQPCKVVFEVHTMDS